MIDFTMVAAKPEQVAEVAAVASPAATAPSGNHQRNTARAPGAKAPAGVGAA